MINYVKEANMSAYRFKCPHCGTVSDIPVGANLCPSCSKELSVTNEGFVQIYRMGSPLGIAVGYGIYINGVPYGHIANTQSIRIPLPYGTYNFHFTCGMTRKCVDVTAVLTPDAPAAFVKARIVPGFWTNKIVAELARPDEMPPLD